MNSCPTPVIVISSRNEDERVFKALELGAVDFIAKPSTVISEDILKITNDLQEKVRSVFKLNMSVIKRRETLLSPPQPTKKSLLPDLPLPLPLPLPLRGGRERVDMVAIGSSTGGPPALQAIFAEMNEQLPFCVAVSQHMPAGFTKAFAERLNRSTAFEIVEAREGDLAVPGRILIAPGGMNLLFHVKGNEVFATLKTPSKSDKYVPSVDVMFSSLADIYGPRMLAVVLTGMGNDGSRGVRKVKSAGGGVFAEAEESAVVFGMPREAIATGVVDRVAPLEKMAKEIMAWCGIVSP
jgi:two-component system, chemotaxis family, protein-glutamate methylesterase/glutaminase